MSARSQCFCLFLLATLAGSCTEPEPVEPSVPRSQLTRRALAERARVASSGRARAPVATFSAITTDDGQSMVDALDIPSTMAPKFLSGDSPDQDAAFVVGPQERIQTFGAIRPTGGDTFLLLSTGPSGDAAKTAEPGTDFGLPGVADDVTTLRFEVTVPAGANRLSFDYTFLSAESPEFKNTQFNDAFTVTVSDDLGANRVVATADVNTSTFHPVSTTTVGRSPFLLYVDDPAQVNDVFDTGEKVDAGTTEFQRVSVPVASGKVTIEFAIRDVGDGILDSAVVIDNVQFSAHEIVDPQGALIDAQSSQVVHTPDPRLATGGAPVRSVAADGVTQVLLRTNVTGAGRATFSLVSGEATDGAVSADDGPPDWGNTAITDAVQIDGQWYVFALYRSPPDFNRGGALGDAQAPVREAHVAMTFAAAGAPFPAQDTTITIVRPPVVVVPDIFTPCRSWDDHKSIMDTNADVDPDPDPRISRLFIVSCAEYQGTSAQSFDAPGNQQLVADAIHEALTKRRDAAVAVTRADVIGHGMGGLLARRYIDQDNFVGPENFQAGAINRLILEHTPNFGSRLADEMVKVREAWKQRDAEGWTSYKANTLEPVGIGFDNADGDLAIQEMGVHGSVIATLGVKGSLQSNVHYHAVVGSGAHIIPRSNASGLMSTGMKTLFLGLESNDPDTINLPRQEREKLLYGRPSIVFCPFLTAAEVADGYEHDLFATTTEQRGGLATDFTTTISVAAGNTSHYRLQTDRQHSEALTNLLDASVAPGGLFTTSMSAPQDVSDQDKKIGCPAPAPPVRQPAPAAAPPGPRVISITSPATGTTVTPGSTVSVTVDTSAGDLPEAVLIVSEGNSVIIEQPPFTGDIVVPVESIGVVHVAAVAFYGHGGMAFAQRATLNVELTATLTAIEVFGGDVALVRPGRTRQLTIVGTYSDGVRRDITAPELGTRYGSSDLTPVATVSASGLITAVGAGDATIAVRNGTVITSIDTKVGAAVCGDGVLDPGEECDDGNVVSGDHCDRLCHRENRAPIAVCAGPTPCNDPGLCAATISNLGAGSTDPDGDALSFTQSPPGPYSVGPHVVSVDVSDGSLHAQCTSELDVLDCEKPILSCPADFAAECTGAGAAAVTPPAARATDNCAVTVTPPAAGSFVLGSHVLTYTAVDPSDNASSCVTTVTVQDTTAPVIGCPAPITAECTGHSRAFVKPARATSSDVCTDVTVSRPEPGFFPLGTTTVTYTSSDRTGNRANCSSTIDVVDTRPPHVESTRSPSISPPDHRYRTVHLADCGIEVKDVCGDRLDASVYRPAITCVTSDEPDNARGGGDGDTDHDIVIVDDTTVRLRAERDATRDGRLYQIHFQVRDASGNTRDGVCRVAVPRDEDCGRHDHGYHDCDVEGGDVRNSVCR